MSRTADLSVIMPTYKHAQYLPRALDALLAQSVRPKELIVINDASPDDTAAILDRYAQSDSVVKPIHNEHNRGVVENMGIGAARASGKYVFCAASDDYVLPGFIERTMAALEEHPEAGLCCSYFSIVDGVTGAIRPNPSCWCDAPRYFSPAETERLLGHACIPGHTTIMKRSAFDAAGGFLADLQWHSDWFLNYVVAFREGMCHVPEPLSLLTEMPGTYSNEGLRSEKQLVVINAVLDRLASPEYADVAPSFARSGVLSVLGPPVLAAAAGRADVWTRNKLSLLNGFAAEQYEALLEHPELAVRELASFFFGPFGHEAKQRRLREGEERKGLEQALAMHESQLAQTQLGLAQTQQSLAKSEEALGRLRRHRSEAELLLARSNQILADREARLCYLEGAAERLSDTVRRMESSYFWKLRQVLANCKHALKPPGRGLPRPAPHG